jgi:two-component system chemotaxis response regulator CheY
MELEINATGPAKTILLIEDSDTVRGFLRRLFEREMPEAAVVEAIEGRAALREMSRRRPDLIVSDLQMPGMDGRDFIAKLRANPLLKKKCVLVLSGEDLSPLRALYAGDAGIRFLSKPSSGADIMQAARSLFGSVSNTPAN